MPMPIITTEDLRVTLEDLFTSYEQFPMLHSDRVARQRDLLRDVRRCCAVLNAREVREALASAARGILARPERDE
jgi:hypothetical protein